MCCYFVDRRSSQMTTQHHKQHFIGNKIRTSITIVVQNEKVKRVANERMIKPPIFTINYSRRTSIACFGCCRSRFVLYDQMCVRIYIHSQQFMGLLVVIASRMEYWVFHKLQLVISPCAVNCKFLRVTRRSLLVQQLRPTNKILEHI